MEWLFDGEVIEWRGPAPYLFVAVPEEDSAEVKEEARGLEYWGQVAVEATIGETDFATALFPKDGRYLLPLRAAIRKQEQIAEGDIVTVRLRLPSRRPD